MNRSSIRITMVLLAVALAAGPAAPGIGNAAQPVTQEELVDLYNKVRQAIIAADPEAFMDLVIPPKPEAKKMTREDLAEAKGFIQDILPDLGTTKLRKFDRDDQEAILVLQTELEDKENISLNVFRFRNKDGRWMLLGSFSGKTFSRQESESEEEAVKRVLDNDLSFQLQAEAKAAQETGSPEPGLTGSGFLALADKKYSFGHAFAFRQKALGYDNKVNLIVVLTEKAISAKAVQAQLREKDDWNEFVNHLKVAVDPEMKPEALWFWVKDGSVSYSGSPENVVGQAAVEGERLKGSLKMDQPGKVFGDDFTFEVAFDAPIIAK